MEQGPEELSDDEAERAGQLQELTDQPLDKDPKDRDANLPDARPESE